MILYALLLNILKEAIEENNHLHQNSFERGFHSIKWETVQQTWARQFPTKERYKHKIWARDFIIAIQQYSYDVWKGRNEILHGTNNEDSREKKQARYREKIKELYKLPRSKLTTEDKNYFKLPLQFRMRSSSSAMMQWIEMAELIHQRAMEKKDKTKIHWFFPFKENEEKDKNINPKGNSDTCEIERKNMKKKQYKQTKLWRI